MSQSMFTAFQALHHQASPLLLPNVWDAASAVLVQNEGAVALATSSAAMAWSLGYTDGSALPQDQLLAAIQRIVRVARVPVTVDFEDGYSDDPQAVAQLALQVVRCGVVGINLEDGTGPAQLLVAKITAIRSALGQLPLFINARTDVVLNNLAQGDAAIAMCTERLNAYRSAGADGAFIPGMGKAADAARIVQSVGLPLNVMTIGSLDPIADLAAAGVKRISAGPTLFQTSYGFGRAQAAKFLSGSDISGLLAHQLPGAVMNAAMKAVGSA